MSGATLARRRDRRAALGRGHDLGLRLFPPWFARPYQSDPVLVRDTFTGPDNALLTARVGELGATWTRHSTSGPGTPVLWGNRIRHDSTGTALMYTSAVMPSADYDVIADHVLVSDNNSSAMGIAGRIDTTLNTCVCARYNTTNDSFELLDIVNGVSTTLGTFATALTGQRVTLRLRGTRAAVLVNGVERISGTTANVAAGRAGVRTGGTNGGTVGVHLDNFEVIGIGTLTWRPPDTTGWPVVHASNANATLDGTDGTTDVVVVIDSPITGIGGLSINNYRNVVLIGGEIDARGLAAGRTAAQMRGIAFTGIRGHAYIEGLLIRGLAANTGIVGALGDGFVFNNITTGLRPTVVTIQNCRVEHARAEALDQQEGDGAYVASEMHPDVIQMFGGQNGYGLRIDKLTAQTSYQGIFNQSGSKPPMDLRRVNIDGDVEAYDGITAVSTYLLYASSNNTLGRHVTCSSVYVKAPVGKSRSQYISHDRVGSSIGPNPGIRGRHFGDALDGIPPLGDFCPAGVAGMGYVTPGYQEAL